MWQLTGNPGFIIPVFLSKPVSTIGLFEQMPVITQVFPVYQMGVQLVETAIKGTQQTAVILDSKRPAIEQNMAIGAQA